MSTADDDVTDAVIASRVRYLVKLSRSDGPLTPEETSELDKLLDLQERRARRQDCSPAAAWRAGYEFCRESVRSGNGDGWLNGVRGAYPMAILPSKAKVEAALAEFLAKNGDTP